MSEGLHKRRRWFRVAFSLQTLFAVVTLAAITTSLTTNPPSLIVEGLILSYPWLAFALLASGVVFWISLGLAAWMLTYGRLRDRQWRQFNLRSVLVVSTALALIIAAVRYVQLTSLVRAREAYSVEVRRQWVHDVRTLQDEVDQLKRQFRKQALRSPRSEIRSVSENPISD